MKFYCTILAKVTFLYAQIVMIYHWFPRNLSWFKKSLSWDWGMKDKRTQKFLTQHGNTYVGYISFGFVVSFLLIFRQLKPLETLRSGKLTHKRFCWRWQFKLTNFDTRFLKRCELYSKKSEWSESKHFLFLCFEKTVEETPWIYLRLFL